MYLQLVCVREKSVTVDFGAKIRSEFSFDISQANVYHGFQPWDLEAHDMMSSA